MEDSQIGLRNSLKVREEPGLIGVLQIVRHEKLSIS